MVRCHNTLLILYRGKFYAFVFLLAWRFDHDLMNHYIMLMGTVLFLYLVEFQIYIDKLFQVPIPTWFSPVNTQIWYLLLNLKLSYSYLFTDACLRCQGESKKDSYGKQDCVVVWGECNHSFHFCCMSLWVKQNNRCPLCQQEWSIQRMGK